MVSLGCVVGVGMVFGILAGTSLRVIVSEGQSGAPEISGRHSSMGCKADALHLSASNAWSASASRERNLWIVCPWASLTSWCDAGIVFVACIFSKYFSTTIR